MQAKHLDGLAQCTLDLARLDNPSQLRQGLLPSRQAELALPIPMHLHSFNLGEPASRNQAPNADGLEKGLTRWRNGIDTGVIGVWLDIRQHGLGTEQGDLLTPPGQCQGQGQAGDPGAADHDVLMNGLAHRRRILIGSAGGGRTGLLGP